MNRKIRVLHIIPSFASGGAEHVVQNYLIDWKDYSEVSRSVQAKVY